MRGADAVAADATAELLASAHGAALAAAGAGLADVTRELKAAVRRRLIGRLLEEAAEAAASPPAPGGGGGSGAGAARSDEDDASPSGRASRTTRPARPPVRPTAVAVLGPAAYERELRAVLAAGEKVTAYGKSPSAPVRQRARNVGGLVSPTGPASSPGAGRHAPTEDTVLTRRPGRGFGGGPSGPRLAAAEAVRRAAALRTAALAWSPPFQHGAAGWASLLAIGTGAGDVWTWRCDHPSTHPSGGAPRFTPLGPARAFGAQPVSALAFAAAQLPTAGCSGSAPPQPPVLVAGGGRGAVAVLSCLHDGGCAGAAPPARAGLLAAADGRAVTCLAARLE